MAQIRSIEAALSRLKTPVFLARQAKGERRPLIALYTTDSRAPRALARAASAELAKEGCDADCQVIVTRERHLRQKSVEALSKAMGSGEIVYDPTGLISRSTAVAACAARVRKGAKAPLKGMYLNAERRTLFVILDEKAFPAGTEALLTKRVEAMAEIASAVQVWRSEYVPDFELAIRIGFELPASISVIPVDRQSVPRGFTSWQRRGLVAAFGSLMGFGGLAAAQAADLPKPPVVAAPVVVAPPLRLPAVAAPNLDILFAGVFLNGTKLPNDNIGAIGLKGAIPLGQRFGLQIDAAAGTDEYWGVGGHLFWRDPSMGLLGGFASHEQLHNVSLDRFGGEAEIYLRNITLRGEAGEQSGDAPHSPFAGLDVTFYATPNFALTGGAQYTDSTVHGLARLEWQPASLSGLSVFADGEWGNNFSKVVAGVTFHFGSKGVTLMDRDRKYDPIFGLFNFPELQNIGYSTPPS